MRPITLKMTAFGPYKNTESIDFNELGGNQLFVISGSTGAGKTTIFDGICFALYGSASGSDRSESRIMRSDFAEDHVHTAVELEFEIHNRRYRILRQMGHIKKGNKGATGEKYEFFEWREGIEVPCVERQIVSEINPRVEEIIGLTQNQFSQIVMLPQGEFRKLLTSETENKEEILRKIFKTEPYKMISERLKRKRAQVEDELKSEQRTTNSQIQGIESSLPPRDSMLFNVLAQDHYNIHQVIAGLQEELSFYGRKTAEDRTKYDEAYKNHANKSAEFHQASGLNERFTDLENKELKLESLMEQVPSYAEKEKQLDRAERASLIEGIESQYRELQKEWLDKKDLLEKVIAAEKNAMEKLEQANSQYSEEEKKQPNREKINESLIRLNDLLPVVKELDQKESEMKELESRVVMLKSIFRKLEIQCSNENETLNAIIQELDRLELQVEPFDMKLEALNIINEQSRVLKEFLAIQHSLQLLETETDRKEQQFKTVKAEYRALEKEWFNNQARVLAAHLHDGEACPVCGSVEHPDKIDDKQTVYPTKEELEKSQTILNQVDGEYRDAIAKRNAIAEQLASVTLSIASFGIDGHQAKEVYASTEESQVKLDAEIALLRKDKASLLKQKRDHQEKMITMKELEVKKTEAAKTYQEADAAYEKSKAIYEDKLQAIPADLRILSQLNQKVKDTALVKARMEQSWSAAQQHRVDASEQHSSCKVTVKHTEEAVQETKDKLDKAELQFELALKNSAFDSEEAYHQARMKESDRVTLKESIQIFQQTLHTLGEQVEELRGSLKEKTKVDLTVLQAAVDELKKIYETAFSEMNHSVECERIADDLIEKITVSSEKAVLKEQQFNQISDLYDVIRGQNGLKISFERYLQIEYLEQILLSANERLKNLSNGQFRLIRSERQESRGKQSGLGLDVHDAYTGQTRDVKTLSGGEKFNASLCLALGMADVIQTFQGNVSIDTMFIDEGFGSLDEESLNKSIDTLVDLQKSGRMIGVISHVQELKSAIPAILEVEKLKEGYSRTRFVIK